MTTADRPGRCYRGGPSDSGMGDWVLGDKLVHGDKVGTKVVYHQQQRRAEASRTLLVLSANPVDTNRLQLDREHRQIVEGVAAAQGLGRLDVRIADAVRIEDLQRRLLTFRPVALHFAGHGNPGGLALVADSGRAQTVPAAAFAELIGIFAGELKCVFLNACYSDDLARAIGALGMCVIGMRGPVLDHTAIQFAEAFYTGAAAGRCVEDAFALGRSRLALEQINAHPPVLFAEPGAARNTYLVEPAGGVR